MNVHDWIQQQLPKIALPNQDVASAYAPSNIALAKYWGKRDTEFNLPWTNSLSISLAHKGTTTAIRLIEASEDTAILNGQPVHKTHAFYRRVTHFLNYFRPKGYAFHVITESHVPIAQGLASSASGFAALALALDQLFQWHAPLRTLSQFARLGSGSACRSLWHGFVEWEAGVAPDGSDSVAHPLDITWPAFCVGLLVHSEQPKEVSSRDGMMHTQETSPFFKAWPDTVNHDLMEIKNALNTQDFERLGRAAEYNAEAMHALMFSARPSLSYTTAQTLAHQADVRRLRKMGIPVYFTQDAGPNIKLLFLAEHQAAIQQAFPAVEIIRPFDWEHQHV